MSTVFPLLPYYTAKVGRKLVHSNDLILEGMKLFDVDYALHVIKHGSGKRLNSKAEKNLKSLREYVMKHVIAYRNFVKNNQADSLIDKKNYLSHYKFSDLIPEGSFVNASVISVSSGSSGKPFFWPRGDYLELETTIIHELLFKDVFKIDKYSTLVINAYSMGMYVAGIFTNNAITRIALRGYEMSLINPGISSDDVVRIVKEIGENYQQIVICGYPPFVKDIIEQGRVNGVNWKNHRLKFVFGAEAISEEWRQNLYKLAGVTDYYHSSFNTYGSADLAMLGHETPFSIYIKKIITENLMLMESVFDHRSVVTLVQYHPTCKYFETVGGELICSGMGGMPLYRYNLHDEGRVYPFDELISLFYSAGIDVVKLAREAGISIWRLPFVVLFGKSDQTVTLYGLNVYPQTIRKGLEKDGLQAIVSARSSMETKYDTNQDQYIEILVELAPGVKKSVSTTSKISNYIFEVLNEDNYEFHTLVEKVGKKVKPHIKTVLYGDIAKNRGIKQQWIKK